MTQMMRIEVKPPVQGSDQLRVTPFMNGLEFTLGVSTNGKRDQVMFVETYPQDGDVAWKIQRALRKQEDAMILTGRVVMVEGRASAVVLRSVQAHVVPTKAETTARLAQARDPRLVKRFEEMARRALVVTSERLKLDVPGLLEVCGVTPVAATPAEPAEPTEPAAQVAAAVASPVSPPVATRDASAEVGDDDDGFDLGAFLCDDAEFVIE